jgi:formate dehydrogenase accessory protein FdhE
VSVWSTRRARALVLAGERAHASEILRCHAEVTDVQERIAARVPASAWESATRVGEGEGPMLRLDRLPLGEARSLFRAFLEEMAAVGTDVMVAEAGSLRSASRDDLGDLLDAALSSASGEEGDPGFHVRSFVETVATTLAGRLPLPPLDAATGSGLGACPVCGAPPVVATLRDLPGALGSGGLVCSRCGTERRIRRLSCAHCGESSADRLRVHTPESVPYVRIDACESCRRYIKTVDLRRQGTAVPIVEDLATPELDLWAREQGLTKGRTNSFGL